MIDGLKYMSLTPFSPMWANGTKGQIKVVQQIFQKKVFADDRCEEDPLGSITWIVKWWCCAENEPGESVWDTKYLPKRMTGFNQSLHFLIGYRPPLKKNGR